MLADLIARVPRKAFERLRAVGALCAGGIEIASWAV